MPSCARVDTSQQAVFAGHWGAACCASIEWVAEQKRCVAAMRVVSATTQAALDAIVRRNLGSELNQNCRLSKVEDVRFVKVIMDQVHQVYVDSTLNVLN